MLTTGASSAMIEVTLIYLLMLLVSVLVRKLVPSIWIGMVYLVLLMGLPAVQDLIRKYHEYGALMPALGLWEGANWLSGCLPFAALYLVNASRQYLQPNGLIGKSRLPNPL